MKYIKASSCFDVLVTLSSDSFHFPGDTYPGEDVFLNLSVHSVRVEPHFSLEKP